MDFTFLFLLVRGRLPLTIQVWHQTLLSWQPRVNNVLWPKHFAWGSFPTWREPGILEILIFIISVFIFYVRNRCVVVFYNLLKREIYCKRHSANILIIQFIHLLGWKYKIKIVYAFLSDKPTNNTNILQEILFLLEKGFLWYSIVYFQKESLTNFDG